MWNKFGCSQLVVEVVTDAFILGLKRPDQIRRNSIYFAVERLINIIKKHGEDELNSICAKLELPKFTRSEVIYLTDYVDAMAPVARSIDLLQAEKKMFMGYLVPTIDSLCKQLADKLTAESSTTCKPLLKALIDGIDTRFSDIVNEPATLAATILHLRFKTYNWMADATLIDRGLCYIRNRHLTYC